MASPVYVDDRDPNLTYFGDWLLDGTGNPKIYDGTLSECQSASSGVSLQFNGTQISVFGTIRSPSNGDPLPISTYKIDGGSLVTYNTPNITGTEGDGLLFFASNTLVPAVHVLVINVTRASQGGPYLLDYITYAPVVDTSSSSLSSSAPSSTPSSSPTLSPSGASSVSASSSGVAASATGAVHNSSSKAGPIAGIVVACVVLLAAIVIGVIFWRRRKRRAGPIPDFTDSPRMTADMSQSYAHPVVSSYTQQQGYDYTPGMTTPFLATHSDSTSPTKSVPTTLEFASMHPSSQPTATSSYIPGGSSSSEPPRPTYTPSRSGQSSSQGSRSGASGKAALLTPVRPLPQPNQTTDSGVRFGPGGAPTDIMSETGEIPPAYSAD